MISVLITVIKAEISVSFLLWVLNFRRFPGDSILMCIVEYKKYTWIYKMLSFNNFN